MKPQSYESHAQYVPVYHFYTFGAWLVLLGWAVYRLATDFSVDRAMVVLLMLVIAFGLFYARFFALRAQDRVIRVEEQLRLTRLLPEALRPRIGELSLGQLIALRFASDAELPELAAKVLDQKIHSSDDIKRQIKTWRPDPVRL